MATAPRTIDSAVIAVIVLDALPNTNLGAYRLALFSSRQLSLLHFKTDLAAALNQACR